MSDALIGEGAEMDYAESLRWYAERSKQGHQQGRSAKDCRVAAEFFQQAGLDRSRRGNHRTRLGRLGRCSLGSSGCRWRRYAWGRDHAVSAGSVFMVT